jgi:hypothetical protein
MTRFVCRPQTCSESTMAHLLACLNRCTTRGIAFQKPVSALHVERFLFKARECLRHGISLARVQNGVRTLCAVNVIHSLTRDRLTAELGATCLPLLVSALAADDVTEWMATKGMRSNSLGYGLSMRHRQDLRRAQRVAHTRWRY